MRVLSLQNCLHRRRRRKGGRPLFLGALLLMVSFGGAGTRAAAAVSGAETGSHLPERADLVVLGGRIVVGDVEGTVHQAMAVAQGRIIALGADAQIEPLAGIGAQVMKLDGRTVLPGIHEGHVHALRASLAYLRDPYQELRSIAEIQAWVRRRAREVPAGEWIRIPRNEITRLKERRHPTVAELDAACDTHPVVFEAVRKFVFNRRGFRELGIDDTARTLPGAEIIPGQDGRPQFLVTSSPQLTSRFASRAAPTAGQKREALLQLHRAYQAVGITTILERGSGLEEFREYEKLKRDGLLTLRTRFTLRDAFRTGDEVRKYVTRERVEPLQGDAWLRICSLKIMADGGIHWGNTYLSEPYGPRRNAFYVRDDPAYRGDLVASIDRMREVFAAAASLGWQMVVHVTGDAGVDAVLQAMEAASRVSPLRDRRFVLTHAYFPTPAHATRAAALGVVVDTQIYTYRMDAPFIHDVYGPTWADRFIGLGTWKRAGVPIVISSDHMVGYDANHAMNSYNPFVELQVAVDRRATDGKVYGADQRLSRIEALRAMTAVPAYFSFEENESGTLARGKYADFIVIDRDYLACPTDEIGRIQVLRTVIDGRTVFERATR